MLPLKNAENTSLRPLVRAATFSFVLLKYYSRGIFFGKRAVRLCSLTCRGEKGSASASAVLPALTQVLYNSAFVTLSS